MCEWICVCLCVCVCVWEYACLKICIICFQLHIQNHFNAEDTVMYFEYMNYQKLLILFSENKILQQDKQPLKENPPDAHKYGEKLCVCSLQNVQRERKREKMPYVIGGNINSSFLSLMCEIFSF